MTAAIRSEDVRREALIRELQAGRYLWHKRLDRRGPVAWTLQPGNEVVLGATVQALRRRGLLVRHGNLWTLA